MATFTWGPDWSAQKKRAPRVTVVQYGDGYEQRSADGINTSPQEWSLTFKRDPDSVDDIDDFLHARNALQAFQWTTPKGDTIVVKCEEWTTAYDSPGWYVLTATFKQVFEVVSA